jgi:hypothetical protein
MCARRFPGLTASSESAMALACPAILTSLPRHSTHARLNTWQRESLLGYTIGSSSKSKNITDNRDNQDNSYSNNNNDDNVIIL